MSDDHRYGVIEVAGVYLGVEIGALIEAVKWPTDLQPHPTERGLLLGLFTLRGKAVPLVDLRPLLGGGEQGPTPLVAVIRYKSGYLGIAIESVCDIARADARLRCDLLTGDGTSGLLPALLTIQDGQRMIYALDLDYLAALPGVIFASDAGRDIQSRVAANTPLQHYLVFECDGRFFCIDASVVTELVDKPVITPSDFSNELCVGVAEVRGKKVAALSLLNILGFETQASAPKNQLLLLTAPDGRISGFGYDRMVAIRRHDPNSLMPVPAYGLRNPDLLSAVMDLADGDQALLLAHETLLERSEVQNYAKIFQHEVVSARETHQAAKAAHRRACLLFHAPIHFAAPLDQISEILDVPSQLIRVHQPANHLLGQFNLRGMQVPLICLSSLIESSPQSPTPASRVLVVSGNHATFGFAVCQVDSIDTFKEFDPQQLNRGYHIHAGKTQSINDRIRSLVSIGNHEQSWRATLLDLRSIALQLEEQGSLALSA